VKLVVEKHPNAESLKTSLKAKGSKGLGKNWGPCVKKMGKRTNGDWEELWVPFEESRS